MINQVRTDSTDSGFREMTEQEEAMLNVLDGVRDFILNDSDSAFLLPHNDLDVVHKLVSIISSFDGKYYPNMK